MAIIKFKPPEKIIPNSSVGGIDYSKWVFSKKFLINLKSKCEKISNMYEDFPKFSYLPITLSFSKVIPKTRRIKNIFKKDSKKPNQIGSSYIFNDNTELKKINLVYSCSKNDLLETIKLISETIAAITSEDISEINKINNAAVSSNEIKNQEIEKYFKE